MNSLENKGVYRIVNLITWDFYIGSTNVSFKRRKSQHFSDLKKQRHKNIYLQRVYNKYGIDSLNFEILFINTNTDSILKKEQEFIDNYKPSYNMLTRVERPRLGVKASKETIKKISDSLKGQIAWNKGLSFSEESRKKMSKSRIGKKPWCTGLVGYNHNPIERSDGKIYKNPYYASLDLGVKPNTIIKAISDKKITRRVKGFTFKYIKLEKK